MRDASSTSFKASADFVASPVALLASVVEDAGSLALAA